MKELDALRVNMLSSWIQPHFLKIDLLPKVLIIYMYLYYHESAWPSSERVIILNFLCGGNLIEIFLRKDNLGHVCSSVGRVC